jgi:hypothetical protein
MLLTMIGTVLYCRIHELSCPDEDTYMKLRKYCVARGLCPKCITYETSWWVEDLDGAKFVFTCPKCGDVTDLIKELW